MMPATRDPETPRVSLGLDGIEEERLLRSQLDKVFNQRAVAFAFIRRRRNAAPN